MEQTLARGRYMFPGGELDCVSNIQLARASIRSAPPGPIAVPGRCPCPDATWTKVNRWRQSRDTS